jgi:hypothetical protein
VSRVRSACRAEFEFHLEFVTRRKQMRETKSNWIIVEIKYRCEKDISWRTLDFFTSPCVGYIVRYRGMNMFVAVFAVHLIFFWSCLGTHRQDIVYIHRGRVERLRSILSLALARY